MKLTLLACGMLACLAAQLGASDPAPHPPAPISALAFRPNFPTLLVGGYQEILVWDIQHANLTRRIGIGDLTGQVRALAFHPDARTLAVAEGIPGVSGAVRLVDFSNGQVTATLCQSKDEIFALAFSADGKLLAAGGVDAIVRVWSVADKKLITELKGHSDWISGLAFSPDGKLLASGSADRTVQVWDTSTWKRIVSLPQNVTEPVSGVAFSPDGATLAFAVGGPEQRAIHTWRPAVLQEEPKAGAQRKVNTRFTKPYDTGTCLAMGVIWPTGARPRFVVPCNDNTLRIMAATGAPLNTLSGHHDWVYGVAASRDGARLASGSGDGTVRLWNGADGAALATLIQLRPRTDEWLILTPQGYYSTSNRAGVEAAAGLEDVQAVRDILSGKPPAKKK